MIIASQKERGVLIVDDDPSVRYALSARLKKEGFTKVLCAEDGLKAVTCLELEGASIYVIITDVVMPAMDGIKLAEYLTANYHHPTGIIYMSGFAERQTEFVVKSFEENEEIMNFEFFMKPFSMEEFIKRVIQCVDLVFNRRISLSRYSIEHISERMFAIDGHLEKLKEEISNLSAERPRSRSFLEDIGFEVIKAIVLAIFVVIALAAMDASQIVNRFQSVLGGDSTPKKLTP